MEQATSAGKTVRRIKCCNNSRKLREVDLTEEAIKGSIQKLVDIDIQFEAQSLLGGLLIERGIYGEID